MNRIFQIKIPCLGAVLVAGLGLLSACGTNSANVAASNAVDSIIVNAQVYTVNPAQPRAQAIAMDEGKIVYVGDNKGAMALRGEHSQLHDAQGQRVIPGLVDAHTHPGTIAYFANAHGLPSTDMDDIRAWLKEFVEDNPETPYIFAGSWRTLDHGVKGPNKSMIDDVVNHIPVMLIDDSGHSILVNSKALEVMGIDENYQDENPKISSFVRDENGEFTGWVKEFSAMPYMHKVYEKGENFEAVLQMFTDFLTYGGVTTMMDGGSFHFQGEVYEALKRLDERGDLHIDIEGTHHVYFASMIDSAVADLKALRAKYQSEHLNFNTIKIHYDGVSEIRTSAVSEDFSDDPGNKGGVLLNEKRLMHFMLELHDEKMDLHLHTVGDRAIHTALNAFEKAKNSLGKTDINVRLTLTHLEFIDPNDIKRMAKLGVVANFTPHWYSGYIEGGEATLAGHREEWGMRVTPYIDENVVVSYSSDVVTPDEFDRAYPFFGMQTIHTRQEVEEGKDGEIYAPAFDRLAIADLIQGYTQGGAYQLRMENRKGSIEVGKEADLVILKQDIFAVDKYDIADIKVAKTFKKGQLVYERSFKDWIEELIYDWFIA